MLVLSTVVAGEGVKWWHFFLCQGIATGVGMGLVFGAGMALVEAMGLEMEGWERGVVGVGGGVGRFPALGIWAGMLMTGRRDGVFGCFGAVVVEG